MFLNGTFSWNLNPGNVRDVANYWWDYGSHTLPGNVNEWNFSGK